MLNFDLFYTSTDYKISGTHTFPGGEVYGFLVYPDVEKYGILQLTRVYTVNKAHRPVIFQLSDASTDIPVALLEFNTNFDDRGIFTNMSGNYCGCMCVSPIFITWVRSLTGFDFTIPRGAVILNPSYCLQGTNGSVDYRIKVEGEPVDQLVMDNGYFVMHDDAYSLYTYRSTYEQVATEQDKGLESLVFRVTGSNKEGVLSGKSIALNMRPPASDKQFNKTYITVTDNTVHFQDAGLE